MPFFGAHSGPLCGIDGKTYAFDPEQNKDPEVAYFNGMVLRVKRALQYLKTTKGRNSCLRFAGQVEARATSLAETLISRGSAFG